MKTRHLIALASATLMLSGCIVLSVYPFYTPKDLVFDPALVGTWSGDGSTEDTNDFWRFEPADGKAYLLTTADNGATKGYEAHLFRLKQQLFLDYCPTNRELEQLPLHNLLKIAQIEPLLQCQPLDYKWLAKLLDENPKALRHIFVPIEPGKTNDQQLVLTASTRELQKFLLKYSRDTNAFSSVEELKRWPK